MLHTDELYLWSSSSTLLLSVALEEADKRKVRHHKCLLPVGVGGRGGSKRAAAPSSTSYLWGLGVEGVPRGLQPPAALPCQPPWLCPAAPAIPRGQSYDGLADWALPSAQPGLPTKEGQPFSRHGLQLHKAGCFGWKTVCAN